MVGAANPGGDILDMACNRRRHYCEVTRLSSGNTRHNELIFIAKSECIRKLQNGNVISVFLQALQG